MQTRWSPRLISLPGASGTMSAYKAEDGFSITVAARDTQGFAEYISFEYIKQEKRLGAGRGLSTDMGDLRRKTRENVHISKDLLYKYFSLELRCLVTQQISDYLILSGFWLNGILSLNHL